MSRSVRARRRDAEALDFVTNTLTSGGLKWGRVVLAEGHLPLLAGVHGLLDDLFNSVLMVADEASLLDAVANHHPDLAVVDLSLPRGSDLNVVRHLMMRHPDVRVLVLSIHDDDTVADQLIEAGACGVMLKRSLALELGPAVERIRQGGTYLSPSLYAVPPRAHLGDG
jgi:DNA-binding NarL/FixJ family response regulator